MVGYERIRKHDWYANGGFSNPRCVRRMRSGSWHYFYRWGG